ncbi:MAG: FtsW/RodA/SpoVE family cell cycle protein, partial [Clostridia bacterium]|nr:FtsW/RodA/SpoVE family cell cycle protein [Clostridia bacterium]
MLKQKKNIGDIWLLIAVVFLAIIGTVFIYSASNYSANKTYGDKFYFVKKQIIGIVLGVIAMIFVAMLDYKKLKKFNLIFAILTVVLLALVFVPNIGVENYG